MKGKYILSFLVATFIATVSYSQSTVIEVQKDTSWKTKFESMLSFSQTTYTNWASGGENNVAGNAIVNIFQDYNKDKIAWNNYLGVAYGLTKLKSYKNIRKLEDKINFTSKFGHKAWRKWDYAALFEFKTQFAKGYNYPDDSTYISDIFSPAYFQFSLGLNYKPAKFFSLFISPIGSRLTVVKDSLLRHRPEGAYGVVGDKITFWQVGGSVNAVFKKDIFKNVNWMSKMDLFSDYTRDPFSPIFSWENNFLMKVNKFLSFTILTQMISDPNTPYIDEQKVVHGSRLQFRETFGIGLTYNFSN